MIKIFINYRTDDEPFGAAFLDRELSQRFGSEIVFMATKSIQAGDDFGEQISAAVRGAQALLVVIGPRWLNATDAKGNVRLKNPNDWVRREIAEAFQHSVRVIPILLDSNMPTEEDLPTDIRRLALCQCLSIHSSTIIDDVQRLAQKLTRLIPDLADTISDGKPKLRAENAVRNKMEDTAAGAEIQPDTTELPSTGSANPTVKFEQRYIDFIKQDNSSFEFFQVTPGRAPAGYSFDEFYVIPSIRRRQTSKNESDLTGTGTDPVNSIVETRRILLLGGAGAGKTTFLTWVAYTVATGYGQEGPWRPAVPFYISLRHFADRELPQPEQLLEISAPPFTGEKPEQWASGLFESGQAILLVDGLDELVAERRDYAKRWLEVFVRAYPKARYIVSTRPSAVDDNWFVDTPERIGLTQFELLSLSRDSLGRVIDRWYAAALIHEADPAQRGWLESCKTDLLTDLSSRPQLRALISSPLLAALLCWLYRQHNKYLPHTRRELLKEALDLLLARWDETKPSSSLAQQGVAVEDELRMTKNEKLILLERFAAPMVRESELLVPKDVAEIRLERAMAGLRSQGLDPAKVLQHLMVRTGLLRGSSSDERIKIEFVHRTFRDYLAATDMVKSGEIKNLVDHAHEDSWYEVVFMAAAQAREKEVADLLKRLLKRATQRATKKDGQMADRLELLAAACLGYADVVDPDQVRMDVQNAVRRLIPPASFDGAEMLAKAGPFVIELLPGPEGLTGDNQDETAARVIRTLAMLGGEEAWEKIRPFTAMHQSTVVDELLRSWRQSDFADKYAQTLLSPVDFGDRVLEVRSWPMLPRLRHLTTLRALKVIGDVALADPRADRDQYPLTNINQLRSLDIVANEIIRDLSPLTRCPNLHSLRIWGYSILRDLSALADSTVEDLTLHPIGRTPHQATADLSTLSGAPLRRLSIRHPELRHGLHPIPSDLPLVELVVDNRAEDRSLLGIERWQSLEIVAASGVPTADEVDALRRLPELRHLVLHTPNPVDDLVRLRPLLECLQIIELHEVNASDIQVAKSALGYSRGVELRINPDR